MLNPIRKFVAICCLAGATLTASAQQTIFFDNMENGTNGWTFWGSSDGIYGDGGLWHQSSLRSYSGSKSWYYGFENGNYYESLENMATLQSPSISLVGYTNATLTLTHFLDMENDPDWDFDMFAIYVVDDENGETVAFYTEGAEATNDHWEHLTVDLSAHVGKTITIYFDAYTTSNCSFDCWWPEAPEGWYIEDVKVVGQ